MPPTPPPPSFSSRKPGTPQECRSVCPTQAPFNLDRPPWPRSWRHIKASLSCLLWGMAWPLPTYCRPTCSSPSSPWVWDSWLWSLALIFASAPLGLATHHIPLAAFQASVFSIALCCVSASGLCPPLALSEDHPPSGLGSENPVAGSEMEVVFSCNCSQRPKKTQICSWS